MSLRHGPPLVAIPGPSIMPERVLAAMRVPMPNIYDGELVDVTAVSKGKGFAGAMKRHNFAGQRASHGGLLIAEATVISDKGFPHHNVPAVYTSSQIENWKRTTDAVHAKGGLIYLQLWHGGRASHPKLQPDEVLPLAPSAIIPEGGGSMLPNGTRAPFVTPRAMTLE